MASPVLISILRSCEPSLLVGVVLSDISDPAGGALRDVPGGHLTMAEWFRTEWSLGITDQVPPQVDAMTGTPLLGKPGDVLLMHHLVPHAVGRNFATTPRIMAYFRVSHPDHANRRLTRCATRASTTQHLARDSGRPVQ